MALDRARSAWDSLAGGPLPVCSSCGNRGGALLLVPDVDVLLHRPGCDAERRELVTGRYSDAAAASILSTAVALWSDTAAGLAGAE